MVNSSTTDGVSNPITIADNLRVDDAIFRMEVGGENPIKVADTIIPIENNEYSLGTSENKFSNSYFGGTVNTRYLNTTEDINVGNNLTVDGTITTNGGLIINSSSGGSPNYIHTITGTGTLAINRGDGVDGDVEIFHNGSINADGSVTVGENLIVSDTLRLYSDSVVDGDIKQGRDDNGAAKALVKISSNGSCSASSRWTFNDSTVTCTRTTTGTYMINFTFQVSDRFIQVTAENSNRVASFADHSTDNSIIYIYTRDVGQGMLMNSASVVTVY